jgi:hypothetical protein
MVAGLVYLLVFLVAPLAFGVGVQFVAQKTPRRVVILRGRLIYIFNGRRFSVAARLKLRLSLPPRWKSSLWNLGQILGVE